MSTKDIIKNSVLNNFTSDISLTRILIALAVTTLLALYIFYVYRLVQKRSFYSADFNKTLALMAVITAAIVLAMQSNLVISLGMVGALSIVRFRNAVKDPIDLVFLFWSISIGIICGAGLYQIAFLASLLVTVLLLLLDHLPAPKAPLLLIINTNSASGMDAIDTITAKHCSSLKMKSQNTSSHGVDVIFEVKCKDTSALFEELTSLPVVENVSLLDHSGEKRF